jgi:hypothetical protein
LTAIRRIHHQQIQQKGHVMKYSNIIGIAAITVAMGMAAPLVIADMHGDKDHMDDMNEDKMHNDARDPSPDASDLADRTETSIGIEARPGSDGRDRDVSGKTDVGLDSENDAGY